MNRLPFAPTDGCCRRCGRAAERLDGEYLCEDCRTHRPCYDRAASALRLEGEAREMVNAFKFRDHVWMRDDFVDWLEAAARTRFRVDGITVVVPMPSTLLHRIDRGYNQCDCLARALARREGVKIRFAKGDLDRWPACFKGPYDLIHSSHALEFADNPAGVIARAAGALAPGGTLVISTVHPLYNGDWVDGVDENGEPDGMGLFLRNYFAPPDDIRRKRGCVEVVSRAYPVSSWFKWMRAAGLEVVELEEPPELHETLADGTPAKPPYTNADWADNEGELAAIPGTLIVAAALTPR